MIVHYRQVSDIKACKSYYRLISELGLHITRLVFLAHLWCAYAMALCLSWIVRREVGCVCVKHNYPKMWMD